MNKNDIAWQELFKQYDILYYIKNDGYFIISSDAINVFRQSRLMTKFDHEINLPNIFKENNLSILPISRGNYIISSFIAYKKFDAPSQNIKKFSLPDHIQSLLPQFIVSETIALNCAFACNILIDFIEEDFLIPSVSGRMGSGSFNFYINTLKCQREIYVNNSQIEIDAAYEGISSLSLIEAKMDLSDGFIIRQLYYPFKTWSNRITKPIKSIFIIFSNGIFHLYQYKFMNPQCYNSLELVKQKNYMVSTDITLQDIENILRNVYIVEEPKIPFPQADNMNRIINLLELLNEKAMTKQEITSKYEFDERQTNYYTDAGRYLNFIDKYEQDNNIMFKLSHDGNSIMNKGYRDRQLYIINQILGHSVFNQVLVIYLNTGIMPDKTTIINIMKSSNLYNIEADTTYYRRTSTISGWIYWILDRIES